MGVSFCRGRRRSRQPLLILDFGNWDLEIGDSEFGIWVLFSAHLLFPKPFRARQACGHNPRFRPRRFLGKQCFQTDLPRRASRSKRSKFLLQGQTPIALEIERNGQTIKLNLVPSIVEETDATGHKITSSRIGITHDGTNDKKGFERLSPLPALVKGVEDTRFIAWTTLRYIGKVFLGTEKANQLHGPVGIAQLAGETASMGMWPFIYFIALISVSIGLVNLFPIPMLDGGHLVFYFIEALIGKPVGAVAQEWSFRIGLSAMLMLMIFATINDLSPYATKIFGP